MSDDEARIRELERQLAAARKTIGALVRRAEQSHLPQGEGAFAVQKAIASLETIIQQRTRALHASEARYRALFDHSPDMVLTVDEDGAITDANQTATRALHASREELVRRPIADLFAAASRPAVERVVQERGVDEVQPELSLRDGRVVSVTAGELPGFGGAVQFVLRDVTSRRTLESELQQARRLAAIGHLAAGVAHEINNPLAVMQLRVDLLRDTVGDEATRAQLEIFDRHLHRIARIVQNLQSFARPRSLEAEDVEVRALIEAALSLAETALQGIAPRIDVVPDDLTACVDPGQIEQVLTNLFANAGQAMGEEGELHIRARGVDDRVRIEVRDTGPGIPDDLLADLFTPFVTTRSAQQGMGLGLAIAWSIVQEHGGTLRAGNLDGGGACFEFALPARQAPTADQDEPPDRLAVPTRTLRVLIVDDEPGMLQAMTAMVREAGHRPVAVATGEQALDAVAEQAFDVLLTDLRMPGMTGIELAEAIRERDPGLAERTVLTSGLFHNPEEGWRYVQKPFGRRELLAVLADAVAGT